MSLKPQLLHIFTFHEFCLLHLFFSLLLNSVLFLVSLVMIMTIHVIKYLTVNNDVSITVYVIQILKVLMRTHLIDCLTIQDDVSLCFFNDSKKLEVMSTVTLLFYYYALYKQKCKNLKEL